MHTETATTVKNKFGKVMDRALREPVVIQRSGRNSVVMIAYEDYEEFAIYRDKIWGEKAARAKKKGMAGKKKSEQLMRKVLNVGA
ncbi:MAG: type II toxin-antitoxin system Phd/YefM family antitoxin [Alphaproteobacteria bacterium]|nr:type II toxin-antitoxin system Phd/YefM family antitoxin [Alphaproteobacteria bacterium]